jgi:hypothetical protein
MDWTFIALVILSVTAFFNFGFLIAYFIELYMDEIRFLEMIHGHRDALNNQYLQDYQDALDGKKSKFVDKLRLSIYN